MHEIRKLGLGVLFTLLVLCSIWSSGSSGGVAHAGPAAASNFSFGQIDWFDPNDVPESPNSSWGVMEADVNGDPTQINYLNVSADAGSGTAWIVQNMPIFPDTIGNADPRQAADFDITLLGYLPPTNLASLRFAFSVDSAIQGGPPSGPMSLPQVVTDVQWNSYFSKPDSPLLPAGGLAAPAGVRIMQDVTDVIQHRDVRAVQEELDGCLAGAFARSIDWLNRTYALKSNKTAQQIYDDLRTLRVSSSVRNDSTRPITAYDADVAAKQNYLKAINPNAVTKILDLDNAIAVPTGVTRETGKDLIAWLRGELPTEDVELHVRHGSGDHIVTVTGIYKSGGKTYLKYRDDETQGNKLPPVGIKQDVTNKDKGDKAEKTAELKREANGDYRFKGDLVRVAISQSVPKPVGGVTELRVDSGDTSGPASDASGSSAVPYSAIAGGLAAAVVVAAIGGWYVRRRFVRR